MNSTRNQGCDQDTSIQASSAYKYLKALDTIGNTQNFSIKNLLGNGQWRAVDSLKHWEKRLPLKDIVFETDVISHWNIKRLKAWRHLKAHKFVQQGCFSFLILLQPIFTDLLFYAFYVEIHQVRILVFDNYRRCPVSLTARLPTISQKYFKFTLRQGIFDSVPCFSSLNPSLDIPKVTGLFLQLRYASGTIYHLILDLVFVPQNSNLFSKLILCHRFSRTNFVVSVFFGFVFGFTVPWTPSRVDMCALQVFAIIIFY